MTTNPLVDRQVEIHTQPASGGYRERRIEPAGGHVPVPFDGDDMGRIAVSAILPPDRSGDRA